MLLGGTPWGSPLLQILFLTDNRVSLSVQKCNWRRKTSEGVPGTKGVSWGPAAIRNPRV